MRTLATACIGLTALFLTALAPRLLPAQQWSSEQQDVWKSVQAYWELGHEEDLEALMAYFSPEYRGWSYQDEVPMESRDSYRRWAAHYAQTGQSVVYDIQPLAILMHGDIAIVHYAYRGLYKGSDGKEEREVGRWTDILKRDGDKWVLIADHGGAQPD